MSTMLKFYACWLLVLCNWRAAPAVALGTDAETLLSIKQQLYTTTQNQMKLESWNSSSGADPCSTWFGVSCQQDSTTVSALSLQFRGFQGPLPDLLGSLPGLQELRLDDNLFTGEIPPTLFQASRLQILTLGHNLLSGAIPENVSNLQALVTLDLRSNQLSGTLQPLQGLNPATLQFLYMDANNLTGDLSPLNRFTGLVVLSVMGNQISGQLDALRSDTGLTALSTLYLSNNQLNGNLSALTTMRQLVRLDLGNNQFSGEIGDTFAGLASLQFLRLNSNNLIGELPSTPRPWIGLLVFNLSSNHFIGSIPPQVCSPGTATMDLSENYFSGSMPDVFASNSSCKSLLEAWWEGNQLMGTINVSGNDSIPLRALSLSRNNLTGSIPETLGGQMPNLEALDLSHNSLQGILPVTPFVGMKQLKTLNLSYNFVSGPVPQVLSQLVLNSKLRVLDLSYNLFSGLLPAFPTGANYEYSFVGNVGLCSQDPTTQLPALCSVPTTVEQAQKPASGKTAIVVGALASVAFVLVVFASALLYLCRVRIEREYRRLDKPDEDLAAAIQEGTHVIPMSSRMLQLASDNFAEDNKIGVGGFGTVYKGTLTDGRLVAIKKSHKLGNEGKQQFLNEVRILSQVNYRSLVRLVGCSLTENFAALVFEFLPQGTLQEHLRGNRRVEGALNWRTRLKIAVQAADALVYLHCHANPPIYHRDIKSSNILLDAKLDAKVADFGISKPATLDATHVSTAKIQGTRGYIDPEYHRTFQLTAKSDVYSFGVVLLELLTAQAPVDHSRGPGNGSLVHWVTTLMKANQFDLILDPTLKDEFEQNGGSARTSMFIVASLASRCIEDQSAKRPDMTAVLSELQLQFGSYQGSSDSCIESPQDDLRYEPFVTQTGLSTAVRIEMADVFSNAQMRSGR